MPEHPLPPRTERFLNGQIHLNGQGFLAVRDEHAIEEMDKADCDPATLDRTYAQFPVINSVVSRWHSVYKQRIRPLLSSTRSSTLLDIGCGGGDIPAALARWAARDRLHLTITAIDPDPRAIAYARTHFAGAGVEFRQTHSSELVSEGATFDVVISNHMLHHLAPTELKVLLTDSAALAEDLVVHSDIARSRLGYALFSVATLPLAVGSFIRRDGLTSIRRSYTPTELRAILPEGWRVESARPYRNLLLYTPGQQHV